MPADDPKAAWPPGALFWPPTHIAYQADYTGQMFLLQSAAVAADTGTGKSMMAMGLAGFCFEEGLVNQVLVCCELNKMREWLDDFRAHTRLDAAIYHGPKRARLLAGPPQVLVTTYETARDDLAVFPPKGSRSRTLSDGPLMSFLRGASVLVIYDEVTKLGRRTSNLYKAHYWACGQLRKARPGATRVIGLSATPMDTGAENVFNEMRIIRPAEMPTVAEFDRRVIRSRDDFGRPSYRQDGLEWFRGICAPYILRKRKSDPDVCELFPPLTEEFRRIRMHPDQYRAYRFLESLAWDEETGEHAVVPGLNVLLRQLAGDPWAVLEAARSGDSQLAALVASQMRDELEACSSAKAEQFITDADLIMAGGGKILAFTFYGRTVLPSLVRRLGDRPVWTYHGGMTSAEREGQKASFKAHRGPGILVASDAGARGINLPEVWNVTEIEAARTHATRMQRAGRGHRLGRREPLTFTTYILESSIEGASAIRSLLARNAVQDLLLGDEDAENYTTADDRRELFAQARPRKAG